MAEALLRVESISKHFGGVVAVDSVSLDVSAGEIHALIGPNGAGKTTLVHLLSGALAPDSGRVFFSGTDLTGRAFHERVGLGLARSYQVTSLFRGFSALDNVALAVQARSGSSLAFWTPVATERALFDEARALLDEPMAGMGPEESERLIALVAALKARVAVLLIEHDMDAVFRLADRVSVLVGGRVIATGRPEEIRANAEVKRAYLGEDVTA